MTCHSIRRLTIAEIRARNDMRSLRYDEIMQEIEAEERAEYLKEFGPTYRSLHAFKLSRNIHDKVERRLADEEKSYNESKAEHDQH